MLALAIGALVVAPLIALREHGNLDGFWSGPDGPLQYLRANWWTGLRQFGVHDLFATTTPWGRETGVSVFDGAVWSLSYEMLCYVVIGILAVTGVLRNSRRFVLALAALGFVIIAGDYWQAGVRIGPIVENYTAVEMPLIGSTSYRWLIYLGFLFLLGSIFDVYAEKIPVHDGLGVLSAVVFVGSLVGGGFYVIGFPAFAYLLVWLGVRMPKQLHWIGRKNDYSYGIYIYGFVGQQIFASLGYGRWGFLPFVGISMVAAIGAGYLSWHLVEKHAMGLKRWSPTVPRTVVDRLPSAVARRLPADWLPKAPVTAPAATGPDGSAGSAGTSGPDATEQVGVVAAGVVAVGAVAAGVAGSPNGAVPAGAVAHTTD
jgi:peptidoglycan/LPS O-acetylase OafA/YrhL